MEQHLTDLYHCLSTLAAQHGAQKLVLFGSRARGDHKKRSDIDLAIWGMPDDHRAQFWWDLEELPTLLKFDIVHIDQDTAPALLANIEQDGVTLYAES